MSLGSINSAFPVPNFRNIALSQGFVNLLLGLRSLKHIKVDYKVALVKIRVSLSFPKLCSRNSSLSQTLLNGGYGGM